VTASAPTRHLPVIRAKEDACMRRRRFLELVGTAAATSACAHDPPRGHATGPAPDPFRHGVASGDPLTDRVIVWTRVTVDDDRDVDVDWIVAQDESFAHPVQRGTFTTSAARDHTVKVDVPGLVPGSVYHYRFTALGIVSPTARTRTLPAANVSHVQIGVVSCSNYPRGHFNVYGALAERDDLDVIVHLGDYIYEYANEGYGDGTPLGRIAEPADRECTTLADYRARHACYKGDAQLRAVHARHPFIAIWDDHEIANNTWVAGAQNHQVEEGAFMVRRNAAVQAWHEWMPVREASDTSRINRSFRFGDVLDLVMLDTRLVGRDRQLGHEHLEVIGSPGRSLLGPEQERWLLDGLQASKAAGIAWRAIGQQVLMTQLRDANGLPANTDMWDGYPAARDRVLGFLDDKEIRDVVVLTGDIHSSWASVLHRDPFAGTPALAVELATPAVSSPVPFEPPDLPRLHATHAHVRWVDMLHQGYLSVRFDAKAAIATWHHTADVLTPHTNVAARKSFAIARGTADLRELPLEIINAT